jgi:hypothetical protein
MHGLPLFNAGRIKTLGKVAVKNCDSISIQLIQNLGKRGIGDGKLKVHT